MRGSDWASVLCVLIVCLSAVWALSIWQSAETRRVLAQYGYEQLMVPNAMYAQPVWRKVAQP